MDVVAVVTRLVATDVSSSDRDRVRDVLRDVTACRNWLTALEISCQSRLEVLAEGDPAVNPDVDNAEATNRSARAGQTASRRARTCRQAPEFERRMAAGELSGEHLDAFIAAVAGMLAAARPRLLALQERLAELACGMTVEEFREQLRREVASIEADDGRSRLQRQKTATRLASVDRSSHRHGPPLRAVRPRDAGSCWRPRCSNGWRRSSTGRTRPGTPDDPVEKQDFLRAHALLSLIRGDRAAGPGHRSSSW